MAQAVQQGQNGYVGGVIVNDGSGWREDEGADSVLGTNAVPWAVAALPDGGAAFTAKSPTQGATIYERSGAGQPWQGFTYPGGFAPGALTLFREDGALRAIGTSSEPATFQAEEEVTPPPGFPADPGGSLSARQRPRPRRAAADGERLERRGARTQRRP